MKKIKLATYFRGIAAKRLSTVEINPKISNQHEINGVTGLRDIFGDTKRENIPTDCFYFDDVEENCRKDDGRLTWYDARENHPYRTEYRLYYSCSEVMAQAKAGDLFVLGIRPSGRAMFMISRRDTTAENQIMSLFSLDPDSLSDKTCQVQKIKPAAELDFISRMILDDLGIEVDESDFSFLDLILKTFPPEKYPSGFPRSDEFSDFARKTLPDITFADNPDKSVLEWMDREEVLFRTLERHLVEDRLRKGFGTDVDAFLEYATSLKQRRSSRAGHALENHLEYIFRQRKIKYARCEITENRSRPDFIFPGIREYRDPRFNEELLVMLGAKRTCKDRWRQVLAEAERVKLKHLFTIEAGITVAQTKEMKANSLQLVIPTPIHRTYSAAQRKWLMNLGAFIDFVRQKQV